MRAPRASPQSNSGLKPPTPAADTPVLAERKRRTPRASSSLGPRAPLVKPPNVRIMCPNLTCRKVLAVPESCRGKTVRCKACSTNIRVPKARPIEPPNAVKAA